MPPDQFQCLGQILLVGFPIGAGNALGHCIIEIDDRLAAMHVVLVGLDGDAGQGGIAADVARLAQVAVAGREAAGKA